MESNFQAVCIHLQGCMLTKHEIKSHADYDIEANHELVVQSELEVIPGIMETASENYICQRCHNQDSRQFYTHSPQLIYCLNCLQLGRISNSTQLYYFPTLPTHPPKSAVKCLWQGNLSPEQAKISGFLQASIQEPDTIDLLHAVTGSGKTEMIFEMVVAVLNQGGRVCLASPRIDVCLELYPRLSAAFPQEKVAILYGGSPLKIHFSSILISTTHQLLRFKSAFDLLVVDEVDAFPYVNEPSLHFGVQRAVKSQGKLVYLTATPDQALEDKIQRQEIRRSLLPARYHRNPLPEPEFRWIGDWRQSIQRRHKGSRLWSDLQAFLSLEGTKLIFMPNIELAQELTAWLNHDLPDHRLKVVHAKDPQRKEKVLSLRRGDLDGLVSTTILERGVTFTHCHVYIVGAEHRQFSKSALVQMSGRVGRKPDYPKGILIYGHYGKSQAMIAARQEIRDMNCLASERGLLNEYQ